MSANTFGHCFRVTTFGESHGVGIGVVIDGVTPDVAIPVEAIQHELNRRRPGQSRLTTARDEPDQVEILSGVFEGRSTGTPLALLIRNTDQRSKDYGNVAELFRPGHADFTYQAKYGIRDYRGGGRSSGRETAARVAAGAVAKLLLERYRVKITASVIQVGKIRAEKYDPAVIEANPVRTADPEMAAAMAAEIDRARMALDSVGGVVECRISGAPVGLGEPVFGRLDAELAQAMLSIGATKGIEFGTGFEAGAMYGSEHNDPIEPMGFATNHAGGILGGISNGDEIVFRVAVKPTASIARKQRTMNVRGEVVDCEVHGRHDPCLCPRMVPVVEAMTALVLIDMVKRHAALMA